MTRTVWLCLDLPAKRVQLSPAAPPSFSRVRDSVECGRTTSGETITRYRRFFLVSEDLLRIEVIFTSKQKKKITMPVIEIAPITSGDQAPPLLAFVPLSPERRRAVKRRLFSDAPDDDNSESLQYASRQLQEQYEDQKLRWNFDFLNERPLPGRYDWQPVNRSATAWLCQPDNIKRSRIDSSVDSSNDSQPIPSLVINKQKGAQSKMTDYMKQSKTTDSSHIPKSRSTCGTPTTAVEPESSALSQESSEN